MKLNKSIGNLTKRLNRLDPHLPTSLVPSSNNRTGLSNWKGKPIIPINEWIKFRDTSYALDYFPDDFDQTLSFIELPYYRYEFERKKRRLEAKRRSDGWLNEEIGYGTICHDSRGNLVDGLGNPIKGVEQLEREEEGQEGDEELELKLKKEQEDVQKWNLDYIQLMEHIKNPKYISHCADAEAQRIF